MALQVDENNYILLLHWISHIKSFELHMNANKIGLSMIWSVCITIQFNAFVNLLTFFYLLHNINVNIFYVN